MATIVRTDPREIDGEPHEVAEAVGNELLEILDAALLATESFHWAARGAWMTSEECRLGEMPPGLEFSGSANGVGIETFHTRLTKERHRIKVLTHSASWDPRARV